MNTPNRILKYLNEFSKPQARCVIISDTNSGRLIISFAGEKMLYKWDDGLYCPGSIVPVNIDPLAAEALILEELQIFMSLEGISESEILYIDQDGNSTNGLEFTPMCLENNFLTTLKKEKIKELYWMFINNNDKLSEEIVGEAIASNVLGPFLSIVNL